jgi:hypothetical protein
MSKTRKFLLSYDEEYDSDIHKVISETPRKRISERLRNLIRLGLMVESQGIQRVVQQRMVPPTHPAPQTVEPEQGTSESHSASSLQTTNQVEPSRERRKRPVRITPPPQS